MSRNLNRDNELGIESSSNNYMETNDVAKNVSAAINVLNNLMILMLLLFEFHFLVQMA